MGTQRYLLGKLGQLFLTLLLILTLAFFLFRVWQPGDPVLTYARQSGSRYTPEQLDVIRHAWGLDIPLPQQYVRYMKEMLTFNFGVSTIVNPGESVSRMFLSRMGKSFLLIMLSTLASIVIGVLLGIKGGWKRQGKLDNASMGSSMLLYAIPEFVLGIIFILLFAGVFKIFPSGRYEDNIATTGVARILNIGKHMFLPWLTLTLAFMGEFYLVMRSSLLDVLGEEYISLARAKGVREKYVLRRHAVPNALLPTITLVALSFGFILSGVITVELVFSYPGVGKLSYDALQLRDFNVLQATFVISVIAILIANFIADLTYGYLDPRVRRA
ncbi:MAG: ABC transporter permease [Nocardioidaceae bacterium]